MTLPEYLLLLLAVGGTVMVLVLTGLLISLFCAVWGEVVQWYYDYLADDADEASEEER